MSVSLFKYFSQPHTYLDNLRSVATVLGSVLIPVAISATSQTRERKRATLDLLRRFTSDQVITGRLERLYRYRRHIEGAPDIANPFSGQAELVTESVLLLNLCDTIAIEVDAGLIDSKMLYRTLGPTLIGAKQVVMARLQNDLGMDLGDAYQDLDRLVIGAVAYQKRKRLTFVTKIPEPFPVASQAVAQIDPPLTQRPDLP